MRNSTTEPNEKEVNEKLNDRTKRKGSKWETQATERNEKEVNEKLNDRTKRKGSKWETQRQNQTNEK